MRKTTITPGGVTLCGWRQRLSHEHGWKTSNECDCTGDLRAVGLPGDTAHPAPGSPYRRTVK